MSTQPGTIAFILEQTKGVTARKMFGEYALYHDAKVVALVCDDRIFVKPTPGALTLLPNAEQGPPYPGAKPHLVADAALDEEGLLQQVLVAVAADLPTPAPKAQKKPKAAKPGKART